MGKITLTDDQQKIYDSIIDNVHNYPGRYESVIVGYAGTGKSTLVSEVIKSLCYGYNISVTSPTHKANQVLSGMLQKAGVDKDDAEVCTIHSFLGLKLVYEKNKQVLKHDPKSKNSTRITDVLIVDECSMIGTTLFQHLITQLHRVRRAIIFIGDSCQLPPVEEDAGTPKDSLSPTFEFGTKYELTQVLRQAMDNPIIRLATSIRECIGTQNDPMQYVVDSECSNIMHVQDDDSFLEAYYQYVKANSVSMLYNNVMDNKIISYTNFNVDMSNIIIRKMLFDQSEDELVQGEPIVFDTSTENCPYMVQQMIQCPEVRKESWMGIDCWQMKLPNGRHILAVGPESKLDLNDKLKVLVDRINNKEKNPFTKKPYMWQDYYLIKDKINVVNYPYATTAHKSQGSTFDNIWFDLNHIERIQDNDTKCRILYTALTRPRFSIIMK